MIDKLVRRISNLLAIGRVTATNDAGGALKAQVQVGSMETFESLPILQHFGLTSVPPNGSQVFIAYIHGDRSKGVVIGTGHAGSRPAGKNPGETVLYNDFGISVALSQAGLVINGGGMPMTINNVPTLTFDGDLHVTGEIIRGFGTADQATLGHHTHTVGSGGGTTSVPVAGT